MTVRLGRRSSILTYMKTTLVARYMFHWNIIWETWTLAGEGHFLKGLARAQENSTGYQRLKAETQTLEFDQAEESSKHTICFSDQVVSWPVSKEITEPQYNLLKWSFSPVSFSEFPEYLSLSVQAHRNRRQILHFHGILWTLPPLPGPPILKHGKYLKGFWWGHWLIKTALDLALRFMDHHDSYQPVMKSCCDDCIGTSKVKPGPQV